MLLLNVFADNYSLLNITDGNFCAECLSSYLANLPKMLWFASGNNTLLGTVLYSFKSVPFPAKPI